MSEAIHEAGRRWDEKFSEAEWPSKPDLALVALASDLPPGKALDIGCGPGRNAVWLASQGWDVTGMDASQVGLNQAVARAKEQGVSIRTVHGDIFTLEMGKGTYDLVVMANIHMPPVLMEQLFYKAQEAVKDGGYLFVIGHHVDDLGKVGPPDADLLFDEEKLQKVVTDLEVIKLQRWERPPDEGDAHASDDETRPVSDIVLWARKAER
ncbi:MAG: methyltransferase domain-containing protein [Firmicutes bacterium]|nr:methyltransferase domain-containing protein [Bacillota bacterium]